MQYFKNIKNSFRRESLKQTKANQTNLLFVHIPKTAGTSFRKSLEKADCEMFYDYAAENPVTSKVVCSFIYEQNDFLKFKAYFDKPLGRVLSGHFALNKYSNFVDSNAIVTFVREPVQQVVSHYNHHVKLSNFEGSITDFIHSDKFKNNQSKMLASLPLSLIGFVGVTESYQESLNCLQRFSGLEVLELHDNVNLSPSVQVTALDARLKKEIEDLNRQDVELYKNAMELLSCRVKFCEKYNPDLWVYSLISSKNYELRGCAFFHGDSSAVELSIYQDNKLVDEVVANQFCGLFPKVNFPRGRYIGFACNMRRLDKSKEIKVLVKSTNQLIFEGLL